MAVVTKQELEDASVDAQTLEDVINGAPDLNGNGTVTSRLGQVVKTVSKSIQDLNTVGVVTSAISALEVELGAPASSAVIKASGDLNLANGIRFNGDTADANKLNDYEEGPSGTFIPVVTNNAIGTPNYLARNLEYTKIGNLVTLRGYVSLDNWDTLGTNEIRITLPFTAGATVEGYFGATYFSGVLPAGVFVANILPSTNEVRFLPNGGGSLGFDEMTASSYILFYASYQVAS
jgi:hypothetical protein